MGLHFIYIFYLISAIYFNENLSHKSLVAKPSKVPKMRMREVFVNSPNLS